MGTASQEPSTYWLLTWLDSQKIRNVEQAAAALAKPSTINELRDVAGQWAESVDAPPLGLNLVAGSGLRLEDDLTCPSPSCRRQQVDVLFRHAWHYFDRILLPDGVGRVLLEPSEAWPQGYTLEVLLNLIDIVLHIQQLGAGHLVCYYPPTRLSPRTQVLENHKNDRWDEAWGDVEATLIAEGEFEFERVGIGKFVVHCLDPLLGVGVSCALELGHDKPDNDEMVRAAVHRMVHLHIRNLETDIVAAQGLKGTLGATVWSHEHVLSRLSKGADTTNVLFRISFPSLAHVPIKELMSLRLQEGDAFLAFRSALTKAVREIVASKPSSDAQTVAAEVVRDVIEPELTRLRQRLKTAQRALHRKSAISIGLAGISTLIGLQLGMNPFVAGGVGVLLSGPIGAASKYVDEKQTIEMSDMYFLWKALQHAE